MSNQEPSGTTPPFLSPAPDYVPADPAKAWERFERLIGKVLEVPNPSSPPLTNTERSKDSDETSDD